MFFDLTPEITLDEKNQRRYLYSRTILYVLALIFAFFAAFTIIFPTRYFYFSFLNPKSNANTIISPRNENGTIPDRGKIPAKNNFLFDATLLGNFSEANVIFRLSKKSNPINGEKIIAKKSYQAFLYPEGDIFAFPDGTLLKYLDNYYIISDKSARKFQDKTTLLALGFNENAFIDISNEELQNTASGKNIVNSNQYPNNSIFKINENYFILFNGKLVKFISEMAYLSHYSVEQAIKKPTDFLQKYPLSEEQIGFADGSLIAYGESAFVVSGKKSFPIDSIETYEAMGYKWKDLKKVGGDEMSFYTKEDLLTLSGAHPDGTVFLSKDSDGSKKEYIIKNGEKHLLPSEKIANLWSKITPIEVSAESLIDYSVCAFGEKWNFSNTYSCNIPIENLQELSGKDYDFSVIFNEDIKIDIAEIRFKKSFTLLNFKRFSANVIKNIRNNYVGQE